MRRKKSTGVFVLCLIWFFVCVWPFVSWAAWEPRRREYIPVGLCAPSMARTLGSHATQLTNFVVPIRYFFATLLWGWGEIESTVVEQSLVDHLIHFSNGHIAPTLSYRGLTAVSRCDLKIALRYLKLITRICSQRRCCRTSRRDRPKLTQLFN